MPICCKTTEIWSDMGMLKVHQGGEGFDTLSVWTCEGDKSVPPMVRSVPPGSGVPRLGLREVLLHVQNGKPASTTPADLRRTNQHLLTVLEACHRADTSRRQLLNTLNTQSTLENVSHVLVARVEAGRSSPEEERRLDLILADLRLSVAQAFAAWDAASRHFTRRTRLFPSQLDVITQGFVPVDSVEIDKMAQTNEVTCPDTLESLRSLARERARQRMRPMPSANNVASHLNAHTARLHEARARTISEFAVARAAYSQAAVDVGLAQLRAERARDVRQGVEAGFRIGTRDAVAFAQAILGQNRLRNDLLMLESRACVACHALYALARRLPEKFDLW